MQDETARASPSTSRRIRPLKDLDMVAAPYPLHAELRHSAEVGATGTSGANGRGAASAPAGQRGPVLKNTGAGASSKLQPAGEASAGRQKSSNNQMLKCPRCHSLNTKFCYYNNYSLLQPRHFCKSCRRYWTKGGALRNVPVGGGCRKSKRSAAAPGSDAAGGGGCVTCKAPAGGVCGCNAAGGAGGWSLAGGGGGARAATSHDQLSNNYKQQLPSALVQRLPPLPHHPYPPLSHLFAGNISQIQPSLSNNSTQLLNAGNFPKLHIHNPLLPASHQLHASAGFRYSFFNPKQSPLTAPAAFATSPGPPPSGHLPDNSHIPTADFSQTLQISSIHDPSMLMGLDLISTSSSTVPLPRLSASTSAHGATSTATPLDADMLLNSNCSYAGNFNHNTISEETENIGADYEDGVQIMAQLERMQPNFSASSCGNLQESINQASINMHEPSSLHRAELVSDNFKIKALEQNLQPVISTAEPCILNAQPSAANHQANYWNCNDPSPWPDINLSAP